MGWLKAPEDAPRGPLVALVGYRWHIDRRPGPWTTTQRDYLELGDRAVAGLQVVRPER